ncbi:unnamed protein product [Ectocarpus sp. 8 AP-2014]
MPGVFVRGDGRGWGYDLRYRMKIFCVFLRCSPGRRYPRRAVLCGLVLGGLFCLMSLLSLSLTLSSLPLVLFGGVCIEGRLLRLLLLVLLRIVVPVLVCRPASNTDDALLGGDGPR